MWYACGEMDQIFTGPGGQKEPDVMRGVPPSERIHQQIGDVLENRLEGVDSPLGPLVRLSAEWVAQEAWEKEKAERLERGDWNGYKSGRLRTAEGEIGVQGV